MPSPSQAQTAFGSAAAPSDVRASTSGQIRWWAQEALSREICPRMLSRSAILAASSGSYEGKFRAHSAIRTRREIPFSFCFNEGRKAIPAQRKRRFRSGRKFAPPQDNHLAFRKPIPPKADPRRAPFGSTDSWRCASFGRRYPTRFWRSRRPRSNQRGLAKVYKISSIEDLPRASGGP